MFPITSPKLDVAKLTPPTRKAPCFSCGECVKKIGVVAVAILETEKSSKKWSVEELKEIIKTYKQKIKDLE